MIFVILYDAIRYQGFIQDFFLWGGGGGWETRAHKSKYVVSYPFLTPFKQIGKKCVAYISYFCLSIQRDLNELTGLPLGRQFICLKPTVPNMTAQRACTEVRSLV